MFVLKNEITGQVVARIESENGFPYWSLLYNQAEAHVFKDAEVLKQLLPIIAVMTEVKESNLVAVTSAEYFCEYSDANQYY